ncbi:MAG TPA: thioredoxin domain-containing protein [Longimicrobiales bacterium]|nr:thioredoxin domain-containing protein [Longimicrobiales bacterium]
MKCRRGAAPAVALLLGSALLGGCGGGAGEAEQSGTESTTRSLLNPNTVGGPSTPISGDPALAGAPSRAYLPELGQNFGSADAPLKMVEFSDFGCGYCRRFHEETFPALRAEFIDTDQIEWKFMPFITGMFENSLVVTEAAECLLEQDVGLFEALSDRLWNRQPEWKGSAEPEGLVRSWADELGGDMDRFDSCLTEDRRLERVAGATVIAQQLGVRGTPTFWLVGFGPLQGALPLETFRGILGAVLEEVEAGADSAASEAPDAS